MVNNVIHTPVNHIINVCFTVPSSCQQYTFWHSLDPVAFIFVFMHYICLRYASSVLITLAVRASTSHLQGRRPGLSVSDRPGTGVPGRRLSAHLRRQHAPTPINRHSDVRRPTIK